jgi:hypothetical protein
MKKRGTGGETRARQEERANDGLSFVSSPFSACERLTTRHTHTHTHTTCADTSKEGTLNNNMRRLVCFFFSQTFRSYVALRGASRDSNLSGAYLCIFRLLFIFRLFFVYYSFSVLYLHSDQSSFQLLLACICLI